MRISEEGQITIPKHLLERCGLTGGAEIQITATGYGLFIRKMPESDDPIDRIYGILHTGMSTDEYMREIRGHDFGG